MNAAKQQEKVKPNTPEQAKALREARRRNYRVKRAHGFKCDECDEEQGLWVVSLGEGDLGVRCGQHVEGLTIMPGQRERG